MQRTSIGDLRQKIGETVMIQGWLQTLRDQKKMQFLIVRDRTGLVQVANWKPNDPDQADAISKITSESAVTITGKVVDNPVVKLNGLELQLEKITVEAQAGEQLPFDPFGENLPAVDIRLDWRYLDLRRAESLLIFKAQTIAEAAMREYWLQHDFMEIHTPKIMSTPSESGAELFEIIYFDRKAYLSQSPQFYKQMAMAAGFERIFEIGPASRADPSFTARHMTEFTGVDMEMSWIELHDDVMKFEECLLQYTYQRVKDALGPEIKELLGTEITVPALPFPRIPMAEAIEILKKEGYQLPPEKKGDIDPAGERLLAQYVKREFNHEFVFLTDWPISVRPFYHMRYVDQPNLTKSFDLICNGLEITTGAQREHRVEILEKTGARERFDPGTDQ